MKLGWLCKIVLILSVSKFIAASQEQVGMTEITPNVVVFATSSGNVVASVGPDGALLVGTPSAASTASINKILATRTKSPVRYVVIYPQDLARSQGDAGWGRLGAFVVTQELALERLGGHAMGPPRPLPSRLTELGVDRPRVSFSEVLSFDVNGEAIHVVHQPPACTNADAIAHFHVANLIYLGEVFPGDGYPSIDAAQGGKLDGVIRLLSAWTAPIFHIVPAHGKVVTGAEVKTFRDMIVTVRDRVQQKIAAGETETQVVADHPTSDFDAQWGHGRVTPDNFVREVYSSMKSR